MERSTTSMGGEHHSASCRVLSTRPPDCARHDARQRRIALARRERGRIPSEAREDRGRAPEHRDGGAWRSRVERSRS